MNIEIPYGTPGHKRVVCTMVLSAPAMLITFCDSRRPEVVVPDQFRVSRLTLRWGYGMVPPIADLCIGEHALSGTMEFGGIPSLVIVPWDSIYAVVMEGNSEGIIWPNDTPADVQVGTGEAKKNHLRLVD